MEIIGPLMQDQILFQNHECTITHLVGQQLFVSIMKWINHFSLNHKNVLLSQ